MTRTHYANCRNTNRSRIDLACNRGGSDFSLLGRRRATQYRFRYIPHICQRERNTDHHAVVPTFR
jgi:hypothetical protein